MSFAFDKNVFINGDIEDLLKTKLNSSLNTTNTNDKQNKGKVKASNNNVFVKNISFNNKPPNIDILGISLSDHSTNTHNEIEYITNSRNNLSNNKKTIKTIIKLLIEDFSIELKSNIESNLLLVYGYTTIDPFIIPEFVCNESFNIPINLKFDHCKLESIFDMNYQVDSMLKLNFKDVDISFEFDCSIPLLSDNIKKRLIDNVDYIFKDVIPNSIMDLSIKYMTEKHEKKMSAVSQEVAINKSILFDDFEEQFAANSAIAKLNQMAQKRFTMSLRNLEEEDFTIERSNLNKILNKRVLRLNKLVKNINIADFNEPFKSNNVLPLNKNTLLSDDLINNIAGLQENLNDMSLKRLGKVKQYRRRKINLNNKSKSDDIASDIKEEIPEPIKNVEPVIEPVADVVAEVEEPQPKLEHPTFTRQFLNRTNSSLMLSPSPINVSFKNNNGFMMNRVITPLMKESKMNMKKNHPLGDYESMIKLNWSDKKKNSPLNDYATLDNTAYMKFMEKTPFKKWFNKEQDYNVDAMTNDFRKNAYSSPPPPYTH